METEKKHWLSLGDVARMNGVHRSTVHAWIITGTPPLGGGPRVKLEARRIGVRWKTTRARVKAFLDALAGERMVEAPTPSKETRAALADQEELAQLLGGKRKPRGRP